MTTFASGIILFRRDAQAVRILLLRNRDTGYWGFPKGRRDPGDAHEIATAAREVAEETGYADLQLEPDYRRAIEYVVRGTPDDGKHKRVVYFLARAPDVEPRLSVEHSEYRWADGSGLRELLAFDGLRELAEHVLQSLQADAR